MRATAGYLRSESSWREGDLAVGCIRWRITVINDDETDSSPEPAKEKSEDILRCHSAEEISSFVPVSSVIIKLSSAVSTKNWQKYIARSKKKTRVHICDRELPFVCGFGCSAVLVGLGGIISILITRCSVADETDSMGSTSLTNERNINCHYRFHLSMLEDLP